ncbi:glycosyltransferase [Vibrio ruber]|uniref:glycosyltransferase n=1 Tax=Vibrio ruber TaxID=184755 RepID=UPI0028931B40|nr:glycosyltransferase [Vibrio ruber]WNJ96487.1 glycosyltransferase [Vibrio ruber]
MKILHVYRTCYPETNGGIEQVIRNICVGTTALGCTSKVLSLTNNKKQVIHVDDTEVTLCKKNFDISSNGFSIDFFTEYMRLSQWADVIHFHYPWPSGDIAALLTINKPKIVTYHSDIVKQKVLKILYKPLETIFLNNVNVLVATSPQYAKSSKNLQNYAKKVETIPLSIDESAYPAATKDVLDKWEKEIGRGFFLFVGVLRYYKGLKYLIEAAKLSNLPIVIAGDGPERKELERLIALYKLDNVKMVGFIEEADKVALHLLSKAFVFPSHLRSEAFGVSLLEAQMLKKPIISCDIGTGSSYVNKNNETGLIIQPANAEQLAEAMQKLHNDEKLRNTLGENARKRFEEKFTTERSSKSYVALYNRLVKK